jgi:flagellar basal-body rod modification protein FlgD
MQNQDPTADTDPNEYINQLVQVNSLEQLIDINQTVSTDLGGVSPNATGSSSSSSAAISNTGSVSTLARSGTALAGSSSQRASSMLSSPQSSTPGQTEGSALAALAARLKQAPGNLGVPEERPAAHRVAESLAGRTPPRQISAGSQ